MQSLRKEIPNLLTLANLACGVLAIAALHWDLAGPWVDLPIYLILLGGLFDVFDGLVARKLGVSGKFGVELDSLADVVTFGVAPCLINLDRFPEWTQSGDAFSVLIIGLFLFHPLMAAYRLATFNLATDQGDHFKGLPSPAAGIMLACWFWAVQSMDDGFWVVITLSMTPLVAFGGGLLMVSKISFFSFKGLGNPFDRTYILLTGGLGVLLIIFLGKGAVSLTLFAYLVLSFVYHLQKKNRAK